MSIIEDKYGRGLIAPIRPEQIDPKAQQINYFPLDAFEFTDPSNTTAPVLRMKSPWSFDVPALTLDGSSTASWGIIPETAWYMGLRIAEDCRFRYGSSYDTTLDLVTCDGGNVQTSGGIQGGFSVDLSDYTDWTVSFQWAGTWQWVTSDNPSKAGPWDWDAGTSTLYIYSGLPYHLPFKVRDVLEIISDVMFWTSIQTDEYLTSLLSGKSRFTFEGSNTNVTGNVVIDGTGFRWYGENGEYILLGETGVFKDVDLEGNWNPDASPPTGWKISANGDVEFNNGTFRGSLDGADGTFAGTVDVEDPAGTNYTIRIEDGAIKLIDPSDATTELGRIKGQDFNLGLSLAKYLQFQVGSNVLNWISSIYGPVLFSSAANADLGLSSEGWDRVFSKKLLLSENSGGTSTESDFVGMIGFRFNSGEVTYGEIYDFFDQYIIVDRRYSCIGSYDGDTLSAIAEVSGPPPAIYLYDANLNLLSVFQEGQSTILARDFFGVLVTLNTGQ